MAHTYYLIGSYTVGSGGASSIDFTGIPGTYTDLLIKLSGRNSVSGNAVSIAFNGNSAVATYIGLQGDGSSKSSFGGTTFSFAGNLNDSTSTANTFASIEMYIPNYTGSTQKSMSIDSVTENNGTTAYATLIASLYNLTSAVTSIKLTPPNSFVQYSTAYLYGIKNS